MDNDTLHDLTAAYALDALEPDEARAYEEHLAGCERCREELASLQAAAGSLAFAAEPAAPRADLRARILTAARAEQPNVIPLRPRRIANPLIAVAAVAACAVAALALWNVSLHNDLNRTRAALRGVPLTGAAGSVVVGAGGSSALVVSNLTPAPAGKTYEAWVIRQDGKALPAGTFSGGGGTIVFRLTRALPAGAVVAVTLERAGGVAAPTRKPFITSQPV